MVKRLSTAVLLFASLSSVYWLVIKLINIESVLYYDVFGILLTLLPAFGVVLGFYIQKGWDGFRSYVGKSIIFISMALFMWFLGQVIWIYFSFTTEEVPYPGAPDFFWVLIDPFYALALLSMMKFSGAKFNFKKSWTHLILLLIPIFSLYINYVIFFGDSSYFDFIDLPVLFDLIYTFGSISIMSLIAIVFVLSINKLGGKMRTAIYLLFFGIVIQYVGDVVYSTISLEEEIYNGTISDFVYFLSIAFITLGISKMDTKALDGRIEEENVS